METYTENEDWECGIPDKTEKTPAVPGMPSDGIVAMSYILAVCIPIIGAILGIYLLAKDRPGHGIAVLVLSLCAAVVIYSMFA